MGYGRTVSVPAVTRMTSLRASRWGLFSVDGRGGGKVPQGLIKTWAGTGPRRFVIRPLGFFLQYHWGVRRPTILFETLLERCRLPGCILLLISSFVLRMHGAFLWSPPEKLSSPFSIYMQLTRTMNMPTVTEQVWLVVLYPIDKDRLNL